MKYFIIYPNGKVEFANYTQLVNYLLKDPARNWSAKTYRNYEQIAERVQITGKDTYIGVVDTHKYLLKSIGVYVTYHDYGTLLRDIRVIDEFGNNVYNFELLKDLHQYTFREDIDKEWRQYFRRNQTSKYDRWNLPLVDFRKDPVPLTGNHHHSNWWRSPKTFQEKKLSCDPEYKDFFRKSRGHHLPSTWDDLSISSNSDISWKRCTKNRHQWENRVKCRNRHVDVYKSVKLVEADDFDYNEEYD